MFHYQNIRSIYNKLAIFTRNIVLFDYDVIALTETWLHNKINDNEFGLFPHYSIYHCHRGSAVGNNVNHSVRDGSLLITIKSHLHSYFILIQNYNIGQLYIKLSIGSLILLIGAVNISPQSGINVYNTHTNTVNNLLTQYCNSKIILLDYYNFLGLQWSIVENNIIIGVSRISSQVSPRKVS